MENSDAPIIPPTHQDVMDWQDHQQGQIEAMQATLCGLLRQLGERDAQLEPHMHSVLAGARDAMSQDKSTPHPTLAGFDSMQAQLLAAFLKPPTASTWQ